jgi:hypothetical protein
MDDTTATASPHDLLLRLAGRVDDDLLADARELVAVGEDGHALELVTAALAADGTQLPPAVRAELVTAATAARIDLDADAALAPAAPDTTAHRFTASTAADVPIIAAVRELPDRLRDGIRLRLSWRQTPAGPAPTPLPYPVLLIETPTDGRTGEVLAYQVGAAMTRSGVPVAVEVLTSGKPLTSYHAAALRDSTPLSSDTPSRPASPQEKVESVVAEVVEEVTASHRTAAPEERPADLFAVDDSPAPRPVPMRAWQSGRRRRGFGEQTTEVGSDDDTPEAPGPLPSPVPLARRTRPRPVEEQPPGADPLAGPLPTADPLLDPADEGDWNDEWVSGDWAVANNTGPQPTVEQPMSGPMRVVPGGRATHGGVAEPDDGFADASVAPGTHNLAGAYPQVVDDSATASTPPTGLPVTDQQAAWRETPGGSHALFTKPDSPDAAEVPGPGAPAHALADPPTGPVGAPVPGSPMAEALLKPEALARLSDADRELLTRLQAELAGGAPLPGGSYGSNGTSGAGPNGSGAA